MSGSPSELAQEALTVCRFAVNGWGCYATRKAEHDEIARIHREIARIQAALRAGASEEEKPPRRRCDAEHPDGRGRCGRWRGHDGSHKLMCGSWKDVWNEGTPAPLPERREPPTCAMCGKPAACFGLYEVPDGEPSYACGSCCGHGNEDGWCLPIRSASCRLEAEAWALQETLSVTANDAKCLTLMIDALERAALGSAPARPAQAPLEITIDLTGVEAVRIEDPMSGFIGELAMSASDVIEALQRQGFKVDPPVSASSGEEAR